MEEDDKLKSELLNKSVIEKVAEEAIRDTDKPIKNEEFLHIQANLIKKHNEKVRLLHERKKMNYDRYVWTMTKTKGEGPITDIIIHPFKKNETIFATIQRGPRIHEKCVPLKLSEFGIKE